MLLKRARYGRTALTLYIVLITFDFICLDFILLPLICTGNYWTDLVYVIHLKITYRFIYRYSYSVR